VPLALRGVFAPLGLGDLGRPQPAAIAASGNRGFGGDGRGPMRAADRSERIETSEPVTETKDIRGGARSSEAPPMGGLPGMAAPLPAAAVGPAAAPRGAPVNPTVRGMNPLQRPADPRNGMPPGNPGPPASAGKGMPPVDDDDVTVVAEARDKARPPAGSKPPGSEDSIDVALSELEHERR
jgi:hypothetical protein